MIPSKGVLFILTFAIENVLTANILYVSPIASPSHHIWNKALALGLVKKGHNITMLTHEIDDDLPANFTLITMEGIYDELYDVFDLEALSNQDVFTDMIVLYDYGLYSCQFDFNSTGLQTLLNYPKDYIFDLIIYDVTVGRCLYPLTERFHNPPMLGVTPFLLPPPLAYVFGSHLYTSYIPFYNTKFTNNMNLVERFLNFIYTYTQVLYRNYIFLPREDALTKERFKDLNFSLDDLERKISLLLCNSDPVMDYSEPLPPNIIAVGGLHARPAKPLPKDIKKIMDGSKSGVILFSLGTNVRSDQLSLETRQSLLDSFEKLPQTVIWKFESDKIERLPKNVFIRKWLPQNDILGHENTKLFINHGGALSSQEAIYHGVPVIGIPHFADQHVNVRKLTEKGIGVHLDKNNLTTENVYEAIQTALKLASKMQALSKKFHDKPQTALETGIFWAEYLLRHGSAEHLVSAARDMPFYQTANLDVAIIFMGGLLLLYSSILLLAACVRLIFSVNEIKRKVKL